MSFFVGSVQRCGFGFRENASELERKLNNHPPEHEGDCHRMNA